MATGAADTPAWIALFLGLYILAVCVAELRSPGGWARMLDELEASFTLRFLSGAFALVLGAVIYLVSPWDRTDWLSITIAVIGGLGVAKGLYFILAGERALALARKLLAAGSTVIAGIDALLGAALLFAALSRLHTI